MHKVCITIESEKSDVIYSAIKEEKVPRAKVNLWMEGKALHVEIEASNASNLRAACNSFLKWIDLIYKIGDVLKE